VQKNRSLGLLPYHIEGLRVPQFGNGRRTKQLLEFD